jgi:hypothetical protein
MKDLVLDLDGKPLVQIAHSLRRFRDEEIVQAMYRAYQSGLSIRQVAALYRGRYKHQTIHGMFARRGFQLRHAKKRRAIEYAGMRFTENNDGYFQAWTGEGFVYLHRRVWEDTFGPIPPGMVVHHKNDDRANNGPENLELKSRAEIIRLRKEHHNQYSTMTPEQIRKKNRLERWALVWDHAHSGGID